MRIKTVVDLKSLSYADTRPSSLGVSKSGGNSIGHQQCGQCIHAIARRQPSAAGTPSFYRTLLLTIAVDTNLNRSRKLFPRLALHKAQPKSESCSLRRLYSSGVSISFENFETSHGAPCKTQLSDAPALVSWCALIAELRARDCCKPERLGTPKPGVAPTVDKKPRPDSLITIQSRVLDGSLLVSFMIFSARSIARCFLVADCVQQQGDDFRFFSPGLASACC